MSIFLFRTPNQYLQTREEGVAEAEETQSISPSTRGRRTSAVPKKAFKIVKKVVVPLKRPLRRKGLRANPQKRWVTFQSAAMPDDHEVFSLGDNPQELGYPTSDIRRKSFDDRSVPSLASGSSSKFQSLPDVKKFAMDKDDVDIWAEDEFPEDQDNLSTANLLLICEEDDADLGDGVHFAVPPDLTVTRASPTPSRSIDATERRLEVVDLDDPERTFVEQSEKYAQDVDSKKIKDKNLEDK